MNCCRVLCGFGMCAFHEKTGGDLDPVLCIKVAGIGEESTLNEKRRELERNIDSQLHVTQSSFDIVKLLHPKASKGNALSVIAADLTIRPEKIVAFGDNHNDIGMFQLAGLSIAMCNAHEEVKSATDYVMLSKQRHSRRCCRD
jgi:hydroxymethylpyrimidine pyrophosphatase-like HAD family hydrolase